MAARSAGEARRAAGAISLAGQALPHRRKGRRALPFGRAAAREAGTERRPDTKETTMPQTKLQRQFDKLYTPATVALSAVIFALLSLYESIPHGSALTMLLTGALCLLTLLKRELRFRWTAMHTCLGALVAYCFLSSLWAWNTRLTHSMAISLLKTMLLFFLLLLCFHREDSSTRLLQAIMWGGNLVLLYIIARYGPLTLIGWLQTNVRIPNDYMNANDMGMVAAIAAIINLQYVLDRKRLKWWDIMMLLDIFMIAVSYSKKAILFLGAGFFFLLLMFELAHKNRKKHLLIFAVIVLAAAFLLLTLPIFEGLRTRIRLSVLTLPGLSETDYSTAARAEYIRIGLRQFWQTPLLGIGMGDSILLGAVYQGRAVYLHSNYVELLACGGLVGFICYYALPAYLLYQLLRYRAFRDGEFKVCLVLLVLLLCMDFAMVSYYSKSIYFYFLLFYCCTQRLKAQATRRGAQ